MSSPNNRKYTSNHEWVMPDSDHNGYYKVGITALRVGQLGTVTNLSFSLGNGSNVSANTTVCTVTGNGSADLHGAMGGILRNERLLDGPGNIGIDPWNDTLFEVEASNPNDYNSLLTAAQYDAL